VVMARWGLIPFWMKEKPKVPHINARAENGAQVAAVSRRIC
jgi:putative SOS response-associated peptidase YedK